MRTLSNLRPCQTIPRYPVFTVTPRGSWKVRLVRLVDSLTDGLTLRSCNLRCSTLHIISPRSIKEARFRVRLKRIFNCKCDLPENCDTIYDMGEKQWDYCVAHVNSINKQLIAFKDMFRNVIYLSYKLQRVKWYSFIVHLVPFARCTTVVYKFRSKIEHVLL